MTLSPRARELAEALVVQLRKEYQDGCRDRYQVDLLVQRWQAAVDQLEPAEGRRLVQSIRPLLRGYHGLGMGERQHTLVETGQDLARLAGIERKPKPAAATVSAPPPAAKANLELDSEVMYLKGVGPQAGTRLHKLGIHNVRDLILHLPRRWEDRTTVRPIGSLRPGAVETVQGKLGTLKTKSPRRGMTITEIPLSDPSGTVILTWFNQPHAIKALQPGSSVLAVGKVEENYGQLQINTPELETGEEHIQAGRIVPVYPLTGQMSQKWLRKVLFQAVPTYAPKLPDPLPEHILQRHGFPRKGPAVVEFHWPGDFTRRDWARRRLAFEELFLVQMELAEQRKDRETEPRKLFYDLAQPLLDSFVQRLPFAPTGAQHRVMGQILQDLARDVPMNRLLQGDVGAGKTVVAAFAAWCAFKSGYQTAIMAPTEILSEQHYHKLQELLEPAGVRCARLSGSQKKSEKRKVYEGLANHSFDLVVGTHALIQEGVEFSKLGTVVVDEQHKFGVMQRTVLRQKGHNPDLLVMTATPIPRTLALTLYGDLEVSRLDELPPGRQPIHSESVPFSERRRVYDEIRQQIKEGRQAYIICPLVEETEKVEATAAVEEAEVLRTRVFPEFSVGLLHGRMKGADKEKVMQDFRQGIHQILISTTVIEVGVDVPNATVMLVQDANRFGLAQLHQLRGRVGRGQHQSRCIFMGDAKSEDSARRLKAIARLSDGFEVAEEDLQIRGPGDFYGLRQSGFPEFKVADLLRDQDLLEIARQEAQQIMRDDPNLLHSEHRHLRGALESRVNRSAELVH
ncbi:MAG: ATP-dependent DNA helicase RecG [Vulcanimicrobiota bacterium]